MSHQIAAGVPEAEIVVDDVLVRRLLHAQHRDLAEKPLIRFTEGWDNVSYRLGDDLLVRLPRRQMAAPLIRREQLWLPRLAPALPVAIPAPQRPGEPTDFYPWHWSIVPYFAGRPVDDAPLGHDAANQVGQFLAVLHAQPVPMDAPRNPFRGVALRERAGHFDERAVSLRKKGLVPQACEAIWLDALAAPIDAAPVWLHGDLHPGNVLCDNGRLSAVIDWGDICAGDPATDLGGLWSLLPDADDRARALAAYGPVSPTLLARARGWAVFFGVMHLASGLVNSERHARIGSGILARLAAQDG